MINSLIYYQQNALKRVGGSAGYLFHLKNGLDKIGCNEIAFLQNSHIREFSPKVKKFIPKKLLNIRKAFYTVRELKNEKYPDIDVGNFRSIHFHSTLSLYWNRKWIDQFKGKVILTSHSPCALHIEMIQDLKEQDAYYFKRKLKELEIIDRYAFDRADVVVFPCEEAEEPYYHTWGGYKSVADHRKYRYLTTGISDCIPLTDRNTIRRKYHIRNDEFVVCFVGRHNEIKGYDIMKQVGQEILKKSQDISFLLAGKEEPLQGLTDRKWCEVGWTNDSYSIINAADVLVLPNKETYFDLVLIESLSIGVPVIASNCGGNKYYKRFHSDAIRLYGDLQELICIIMDCYEQKERTKKAGEEARKIYEEHFTDVVFATNYCELIRNICHG